MKTAISCAGLARTTVEKCFQRAEPLNAPSLVTGTAIHWLLSTARRDGWTLFHADPKRGPFHVGKSALIRGRKLKVSIFINCYGGVYCTRWRVDGRAWSRKEVEQSFGF
jgi:hypothetical protein